MVGFDDLKGIFQPKEFYDVLNSAQTFKVLVY